MGSPAPVGRCDHVDPDLRAAVDEHRDDLREAVRVVAFLSDPPAETREWTVDGACLELGLDPVTVDAAVG